MKVNVPIPLFVLASSLLLWPQEQSDAVPLECKGSGENRNFTLKSVSVAGGFEKFILSGHANIKYEYLVDAVRKIPVGDRKSLVGTKLATQTESDRLELLLEPDSFFEMYRSQLAIGTAASSDFVFVFDHQVSGLETIDLQTGRRSRDNRREQVRVTLVCDRFPEYVQYIEKQHASRQESATAVPSWHGISEIRLQALAARFTTAYVDHDLVFNNQFLGVEIWQNPFDMWVFQQMITELKPDVIIETGTAHGGSALYFATMLEAINPSGRIITVEIDPDVDRNISEARQFPAFSEKVTLIKGDSVSERTINRIEKVIEGIRRDKRKRLGNAEPQDLTVLVTLDSLHSAKHVLDELRLYSRFVSNGSYIVVQDTVIDQNPKFFDWFVRPWADGATAGPLRAANEFLEENPDFRRDSHWEKFYFTFYSGGFLKKDK